MFSCQHLYLEKAQVRIALFWIVTMSVPYNRSSVLVSTPISKESLIVKRLSVWSIFKSNWLTSLPYSSQLLFD